MKNNSTVNSCQIDILPLNYIYHRHCPR